MWKILKNISPSLLFCSVHGSNGADLECVDNILKYLSNDTSAARRIQVTHTHEPRELHDSSITNQKLRIICCTVWPCFDRKSFYACENHMSHRIILVHARRTENTCTAIITWWRSELKFSATRAVYALHSFILAIFLQFFNNILDSWAIKIRCEDCSQILIYFIACREESLKRMKQNSANQICCRNA